MNVELKITLSAADGAVVAKAMALDAGEARRVVFFDTPDLALFGRGMILRARAVHGGGDDVTVKLRAADAKITDAIRALEGFKIEADRSDTSNVVNASLTEKTKGKKIEEVVEKKHDIASLFSDAQRALVDANGGAPWSTLVVLGPIETTVWKKRKAPSLAVEATLEKWCIPGAEVYEISTRVDESAADAAMRSLAAFLEHNGVKPVSLVETKTKAALEALTKPMRTPK